MLVEKKKTSFVTWLVLFTVIIVAGNAMLSEDPPTPPKPQKTEEQKLADAENAKSYAYVMAAEKILRSGLKDPESAKISRSHYSEPYVCGYLNAKNSFGGFTGDKEFMVNTVTGEVFVREQTGNFVSLWNEHCI
tara:strand:- start:3863 stop:4264 length:402 start_codon:yes stop_codon:yes gene_type:complete